VDIVDTYGELIIHLIATEYTPQEACKVRAFFAHFTFVFCYCHTSVTVIGQCAPVLLLESQHNRNVSSISSIMSPLTNEEAMKPDQ